MDTTRRRPAKTASDPRLHTASWKAIRKHWAQRAARGGLMCQAPGCRYPGHPIRTGTPRGPLHLDVGHHIDRAHDPRQKWEVADTRPEHARCNRRAGATAGNQARGRARRRTSSATSNPTGAMLVIINDF